jgi:hypothetical protein
MIKKLTEYIKHPESMDALSLKYLENLLVEYPYFQTVHLLYLQNLKRLNDSRFEEQLHISALYIFDRRLLYHLVQNTPVGECTSPVREEEEDTRNPVLAATKEPEETVEEEVQPEGVIRFASENTSTVSEGAQVSESASASENALVIESESAVPEDSVVASEDDSSAPEGSPVVSEGESAVPEEVHPVRRTPSPLKATTDYMQYLLQMESESMPDVTDVPLQGQGLIDSFLEKHESDDRMYLGGEDTYEPILEPQLDVDADDGIFTETLASIYIKQGRYLKAIEIIRRLSLKYPKKNRYFADQIRYLEKLIITNKK